jgi:hypothetical protein
MAADAVIVPTVYQLRQYCTPFGGRVAAAADFHQGLEAYSANLALPAAYVVPQPQEAEDRNLSQPGYWQIVHKMLAVTVELDATADRRGQHPIVEVEEIEAALFSTLLNWEPVKCRSPNKQGFQFAGGRFLDLDRARLFYQWEFLLPWQLTDDDGWHDPTPPVDLVGIELDIYNAPPWQMPPPAPEAPAAIVMIPTTDQPVSPPPTVQPLEDPQ